MSVLDKLKETSLIAEIIKFVQLIAKDKLEKMEHPPLYVQLASKKPAVVRVTDGRIEVKASFPKNGKKLKNLPIGAVLLVTEWKLMICLNEATQETSFEIAIDKYEKIGTAPMEKEVRQPEDEPELEIAYTILSRLFEAKKFNNFYNANKSLEKIKTTLCQAEEAARANKSNGASVDTFMQKKKQNTRKTPPKLVVGPRSASKFSPKTVDAEYFEEEEVEEISEEEEETMEVPRRFVPLQRGNGENSGRYHADDQDDYERLNEYIRQRQMSRQTMEIEVPRNYGAQPQKRSYEAYSHQYRNDRDVPEDNIFAAKRGKFSENTKKQTENVERTRKTNRDSDLLAFLDDTIEEEEETSFHANSRGTAQRNFQPVTSYQRNERQRESEPKLDARQKARIEITKALLQQDQENIEKQAAEKKRQLDLEEKRMLMKMMSKTTKGQAAEKQAANHSEPLAFSRESFIASSFFELPKDTYAYVEKPLAKTKNSRFGKLTAGLNRKPKEQSQAAQEGAVLKEIQNSAAVEQRDNAAPQESNGERVSTEDMRIFFMLMKERELEKLLLPGN